ncbi:hypothetical protein CLU85_0898 [Acidovorax sp. 69]|nr:hypothetical protein CLU85_0898 [Acidovorax sp. 69]
MLVLSAEAGLSPRRASDFLLLRQKKVTKEKATPSLRPLRCATGRPAAGRLRGAPWNSLCAARAARTTTASQFTRHARSDARAHPATAPPQAQPAGVGSPTAKQPDSQTAKQPDIHSGHRFARPRLRSAKRLRPRVRGRAKQWPAWMSAPRVPFRMRRGAQGPADQGSRLSERSEFERDPAGREHRRLPLAPARACGDAACRVAFSLVTFFWRSKRKPLRRRAHTPASALNPSTPLQPARKASTSSARTDGGGARLRQAQPERMVRAHRLQQAQPKETLKNAPVLQKQ